MKLWHSTIEVEVYYASDHEPNQWDLEEAARESLADGGSSVVWPVTEVLVAKDIPSEWQDCIPYGDNCDDMTCKEIVEKREDERKEEAWHKPMPNQKELPL